MSEYNVCCSYVCSLEDAVCSEIEDGNTIEHCRLSQCDRTQIHTEKVQRKQKFKKKTLLTCNKITTIVCSYVLWERERVLVMQPQYKIRKLGGCVNVNRIVHTKIRLKKPSAGYSTAGLHKECVMTGDSFIMYSCQLIDVIEWYVFR